MNLRNPKTNREQYKLIYDNQTKVDMIGSYFQRTGILRPFSIFSHLYLFRLENYFYVVKVNYYYLDSKPTNNSGLWFVLHQSLNVNYIKKVKPIFKDAIKEWKFKQKFLKEINS